MYRLPNSYLTPLIFPTILLVKKVMANISKSGKEDRVITRFDLNIF